MSANDLIASAHHVLAPMCFETWSRNVLRGMLAHQALLCGQLVPHSAGYTTLQRCGVDMPEAYLATLAGPGNNLRSAMLTHWLQDPEHPHFFDPHRDVAWGQAHPSWYAHYLATGWRNSLVLGHVVGEGDDQVLTTATFYNVDPALEPRALELQRTVMPALHEALCHWYLASQAPALTPAEENIASLLKQGKSTKAIAKELGKSDHTVKHQITALMRKFGVDSRIELVARLSRL